MTATLEQANETIRSSVTARMASTPADDPKMVGWRVDEQDAPQADTYAAWEPTAFQSATTAHSTLMAAVRAVADRHTKYGPPTEHFAKTAALVNAAFGTSFTASDWALVMVLDKVARLRGPTPTTDGGVDIAGYAACYEECRTA